MDRFSLLLLEPGEIYFEDFKVVYHKEPESRSPRPHDEIPGRLKVCSKSVVFVPSDQVLPMLKMPFVQCDIVDEWTPRSFQAKLASAREVLYVSCSQTVEMLRQNIIAPFNFRRTKERLVFSFTYRKVSDCLPQILQLQRASTLPPVEQNSMIGAIVFSRQSRLSFDTCWLENIQETIVLETVGNKITPLVVNPGRVLLSSHRLYFQAYNNIETQPVLKIKLESIVRIYRRRYLLRPQGLEIEYLNHKAVASHIYLSFNKPETRDTLYNAMRGQDELKLTDDNSDENNLVTMQWQNGVLSNFDYLLYLNSCADRSFNDLSQYPVFPWVVNDYTSHVLDLNNEKTFRDLSKPIGALNQERLESLRSRSLEMPEPHYLYGSHYSTPGFVLYYLVRKVPAFMLCLQNGRFDHPDRMFNSIPQTWRNVTTNQSDFKELVPEFYMPEGMGDFLTNSLDIDFGRRHDGTVVNDVALPPWAENAADFVSKLRMALETDYVSKNLHHWIDLLFGFKQRGDEAVKCDNVFYPICYEGSVDLDKISDLNERYAMEVQISEFGQIPKQIFKNPHPQRYTSIPPSIQYSPAKKINKKQHVREKWKKLRQLRRCSDYLAHKEPISATCLTNHSSVLVSASQDSVLKVYNLRETQVERSVSVKSMTISAVVAPGDGDFLVLAMWDNSLLTYCLSQGSMSSPLSAHSDAVSCLGWSRDSRGSSEGESRGLLASGSWDSSVKVWRCDGEKDYCVVAADLLAVLDHGSQVTCLDMQAQAGQIVTGTREGEVVLWCLETNSSWSVQQQLPSHARQVNALAFSPAGTQVISAGSDFYMKVFDLKTGTVIFSKNLGEEIVCVCWDGLLALVAGGRGEVSLWDLLAGRQVSRQSAHQGKVTCLTVSQDGNVIVTAGEDKRVIVWRPEL